MTLVLCVLCFLFGYLWGFDWERASEPVLYCACGGELHVFRTTIRGRSWTVHHCSACDPTPWFALE